MSTKEIQEKIVANMKRWQKLENATVAKTGEIIQSTNNVIVRLVMEIIQNDSMMHHRIQQLIAASLTHETISLNPDELENVWSMIEDHIKMEKESVSLAEEAKEALAGKKMVVQEYLLDFLLADEKKHDNLLETLGTIKKGMYPYG